MARISLLFGHTVVRWYRNCAVVLPVEYQISDHLFCSLADGISQAEHVIVHAITRPGNTIFDQRHLTN